MSAQGRHGGPDVRIVSQGTGALPPLRAGGAGSHNAPDAESVNLAILTPLLFVSSALALYDLYLLVKVLAAGG